MKKLFILSLCLIVLAGCTSQTNTNTNSNGNQNTNQQTQSQKSDLEFAMEKLKHDNLVTAYNQAIIKTNQGNIKVEFYNDDSPVTVNNFLNLAQQGFYDETKFHRVIKDFMIQAGDPNSKDNDWTDDGAGGPGYKFKDEINDHKLVRGSLAMANSGPNTNGSQFFIVTADETPWLDGAHTNFGKVLEGMDVVDKIEAAEVDANNHPLEDVTIKSIELIEK